MKFPFFSVVHWHIVIWKHVLKSDLDFLILIFQVHGFISIHNAMGMILIDVKAVASQYL